MIVCGKCCVALFEQLSTAEDSGVAAGPKQSCT
jgi:hypothetical protein